MTTKTRKNARQLRKIARVLIESGTENNRRVLRRLARELLSR